MSAIQLYVIGGIVLVATLAFVMARLPSFQNDLRRPISVGVGVLALLTLVLSIQVLSTGFRLRNAALVDAGGPLVAQWNGLVLGAILLLMVSALAFFFALGAFIWSLIPPTPAPPPAEPKSFNPFAGFDRASQTLNPLQQR